MDIIWLMVFVLQNVIENPCPGTYTCIDNENVFHLSLSSQEYKLTYNEV